MIRGTPGMFRRVCGLAGRTFAGVAQLIHGGRWVVDADGVDSSWPPPDRSDGCVAG